jgi:type IV pilus assembly protein PilA
MNHKSKKGFTLVEIMIVVVIIGLLAAMAIPAFQKVRQSSVEKTVVNDGRLIGHAAQQYFMDYGTNEVNISTLVGDDEYVTDLSRGVSHNNPAITTDTDFTFTLSHANLDAPISFDNSGEKQ